MQTTNNVLNALRLSRALTEHLAVGSKPSRSDIESVDLALKRALEDVDAAQIVPSRSADAG